MPFELFIAVRYLLAKRKQAFISLISLISTIGVAVGVMALIVALALMTGLQGELRDRILGSMAHVYVWHQGGVTDYRADIARLEQVEGVIGAAPAVDGKAAISSADNSTFISFKGIDPAFEGRVTDLEVSMQQGRIAELAEESDDELPGILLGRELAAQLRVGVGDRVQLTTQQGTMVPGGVMLRPRTARVAGIYSLGLYEFDAAYGFVSLAFAERLVGRDAPDRIQVKVADIDRAPEVSARIRAQLGSEYLSEDWTDTNQQLFSALRLEKMGMSLAVGLIVTVAALNIVASLVLLVMEKSRDIAILKTMGTAAPVIMRIFMLQGLLIGAVGTTAGALGGVALCWVLDTYKVLQISMDVYQVSYVPFVVLPGDLATIVAASLLISFAATIYPSRQAAKLDPVQALRFE